MAINRKSIQLSKFIGYVLGKEPGEFGLVPGEDGFFKTKEFLKAVWEEEGYRHVRESHLNEILLTVPDPPFEIKEKLIRSVDWRKLPSIAEADNLPKLLYTCVRRKAHAFALEKGIFPVGHDRVVLSSKPEMARRIGRRFDGDPVLMTVQTAASTECGVVFFRAGDDLYLADSIPAGCFTGPPPPKEKPLDQKPKKLKEETETAERTPGSYFVDLTPKKERKKKDHRNRQKDIAWKRERKRKQRTGEKW